MPKFCTFTNRFSAIGRILFLAVLLGLGQSTLAAGNILVFGDSLSAGYGISLPSSWANLLQERLQLRGLDYNVVNMSISGETTAGGRSRLPDALRRNQPQVVILALGSNDGLRGLSLNQMRANLAAMVTEVKKIKGTRILLVGGRLPPNFGPYATQFEKVFSELAREQQLPLVKSLVEGFATQPELFQADGLHPTSAAQPLILNTLWSPLQALLK